jgi:Response receiver domain
MSATPMTAFEQFSNGIAARYLQTVVVLDDEAYFQERERELLTSDKDTQAISELQEPDPHLTAETKSVNSADDVRAPSVSHQLDAKILIDSFALEGLVCAVLAPGVGEDLEEHTALTAKNADIVVLDWQLGKDDGTKAMAVLKRILMEDGKRGGRLRLLAIYTGEQDLLNRCVAPVKVALPELASVANDPLVLQTSHARLLFLTKSLGGTRNASGEIDETQLPKVLISEFTRMTQGLLSNAAMAALAAIREDCHKVLSRFNSRLDCAYLSHRILLKSPEDAQQFAIDLVADELRTILEAHSIATEVMSCDVLNQFVEHCAKAGVAFNVRKQQQPGNAELSSISQEQLITALSKGIEEVTAGNNTTPWGSKGHLHKRIHTLLNPDADVGLRGHCEFARLSALRREAFGQARTGETWIPGLDLGTIVADDQHNYFLCLQPPCDCVRLSCGIETPFVFAPFTLSDEVFDLVVCDGQEKDVFLKFDPAPFRTKVFHFIPGESARVEAQIVDGSRRFQYKKPTDGYLVWIADLRLAFALRLVQRVSNQLSRIGLDEFEWQRKYATK